MLQHIHRNRAIIIFLVISALTILTYVWFLDSNYFPVFSQWAGEHPILLFFSLVLVKILAIIWPPASGSLLLIGMIPVIGWPSVYLIDLVGSIVGSSIAFFIGERYGIPLLRQLFDDEVVKKIQRFHLVPNREIEAILVMRILSGGVFFEAVCYGAGVMGVKFQHFFVANLIFHLTVGIPMFYLFGNIMTGTHRYLSIGLVIIAVAIIYLLRNRYFVISPKESTE